MATASFCTSLGHQVEGQMPRPSLDYQRTMSLKPAVSSGSLSRSCWREVSMHPPAVDNIGKPKSSQVLSFRPTVLSFSSFTYVGRTVPLEPTGSIGAINPFLGILLFCQPCGALDHWSKDKYVNIPSVSEKNDYTLLGNEPDDVDKDHESTYKECESDCGEDYSSSGEEEDWEDDSDSVTTSDCESVVEFESSGQSNKTKCEPCLPILSHTFSFSSEESGFCEQLHCEWSEDDDLPDCDFNEGLWHNFERQACFTGIPLKKEKPKTKCVTRPQTRLTIQHTSSSSGAKSSRVNTLMCTTYNSHCVVFPSVNKHTSVDTDKDNMAAVTQKRVSFKPDHELVTVHYMIAWKYAYRACRKGPWEQYAADRDRFNKRIQTVDSMLTPCLVKKLSYHL